MVLVLVATMLAVHATPITVPNASFDQPTVSTSTTTNSTIIPGWVFNVHDGGEFGTAPISYNFSSAGASSGTNYAFIENNDPAVTDTITSAASLGTIAPLTDYTLTVAIGNVQVSDTGAYGAPGNVTFGLLANGVVIATEEVPNGTVPNGTFEDFSLNFVTPPLASFVGESLTIQLATVPGGTAIGYQAAFDNVTLVATSLVTPEPKTWMLLLGGMLTLGVLLQWKQA
jgi:hypothetical protein